MIIVYTGINTHLNAYYDMQRPIDENWYHVVQDTLCDILAYKWQWLCTVHLFSILLLPHLDALHFVKNFNKIICICCAINFAVYLRSTPPPHSSLLSMSENINNQPIAITLLSATPLPCWSVSVY